ncbi:MAG: RNA-binding domain-containing protein [bacterium]
MRVEVGSAFVPPKAFYFWEIFARVDLMKYPVVIKRSPLALIKNIVLVELTAGFLLFSSAFLANYEKIYHFAFASIIRYDYFLIAASSFFQMIITFVIFLRWHNENYEIREKEIVGKKGIFATTQTFFSLANAKDVVYKQGIFEKLTGYGTIVIRDSNSRSLLRLRSIENGELLVGAIKGLIERLGVLAADKGGQKPSVLDLLLDSESNRLEFKQTLRWDARQNNVNKDLEKTTMKTIASFLNVEGGNLILGVADNKSLFGLEADYKSLPRTDKDGFENHFNHVFNVMLGPRFRPFVKLNFEKINNKEICLVDVRPSDSPVYLKTNAGGSEEFFIRTGNAAAHLSMSESADYIKSRWG